MRYSASEKLEIIELVEQSTLSVGRTLASIGIDRRPRRRCHRGRARCPDRGAAPRARSERLKVPQVDHETDVEKWFIDRHRSEKSVPQATVVGSFT